MQGQQPHPLPPHHIVYCIILYEALSNPLLSSSHRDALFSFLLSEISTCAVHKSLVSLLRSMHTHSIPRDIIDLVHSRVTNVRSIDDIFTLFNTNLREIRGEEVKINESRHLETGGIFDTFTRRCSLDFTKMFFEELCGTFGLFVEFCKEEIPAGHPINFALDERIAANALFKSAEQTGSGKGPVQHFLKYVEECAMHHPNAAIDSLHNYFHTVSGAIQQRKIADKPQVQPKMHYASLNLSSVHYRFGQFDEALLNIAETIKIAQSKNDREAIIYSMLWLSCILSELGLVGLQKTLLQHILMESHEQKLNYLFILAAQNFAALEHTYRPMLATESIPGKFCVRLGLAECTEPIWGKVLWMAMQKLNSLKTEPMANIQIGHVRPLGMILKAFNYSVHGVDALFSPAEKVQYSFYNSEISKDASLTSYMLLMGIKKAEDSMKGAFESIRQVVFAQNRKSAVSDDWFTVLLLAHKFELNRNNVTKCRKIESLLFDFALHFRKASHLCSAWQLKNERLLHQCSLHEALISIQKLIKFSSKHGLVYRTVHDYFSIVQLYIYAKEYSQAMLAVLKCIEIVKEFHLETHALKAEIKLAEIMNLLDMPSEALKTLEQISEKVQLLVNTCLKTEFELVKAKVLIKLQKPLLGKVYANSSMPLYEAAAVSLKKGLEFAMPQCNLFVMREIYYLLARVYHELNETKKRDQAALYFLYSDEELQANLRSNPGYTLHFDLPELIEAILKQINNFTDKYHSIS